MTNTLKFKKEIDVPVRYLFADCGVRYWEDATVNGEEDEDGSRIPGKEGDRWRVVIDLETGVIQDWPQGTIASIHYKVCDDGVYTLRDENNLDIANVDDYVINMMCPEGDGYGDYVIMNVDENGKIDKWKVDLVEFENQEKGSW